MSILIVCNEYKSSILVHVILVNSYIYIFIHILHDTNSFKETNRCPLNECSEISRCILLAILKARHTSKRLSTKHKRQTKLMIPSRQNIRDLQ